MVPWLATLLAASHAEPPPAVAVCARHSTERSLDFTEGEVLDGRMVWTSTAWASAFSSLERPLLGLLDPSLGAEKINKKVRPFFTT